MRVLLKMVIDCTPEAAWCAIRSPAVLETVSRPFTVFRSLEPGGFPGLWNAGVHPVAVSMGGIWPLGTQTIDIGFTERAGGVHIMRDSGRGLSGPLTLVTGWEHSMAISPAPGGRTLYRDQLVFTAGLFGALLWPVYWVFWQWRARGIRRYAASW